jgi:glycosyltransferase involved in cell wall biosynthesis
MKQPTIAVITTTKNDERHLLPTLASLHLQSYRNWKHYIKDAASTDKTLTIIETNGVRLHLLTGNDNGVYDALNIITRDITEEWTIVIQAGDRFADTKVLEQIAPLLTDEVDIVYGSIENMHNLGVKQHINAKPPAQLWKGMVASHQAMFIRTSFLKQFPYDLQYTIAADYDFLWKCVKAGARLQKVDLTIAVVDGNGLASKNIIENFKQKRAIVKKFTSNIFYDAYWAKEIARVSATGVLKTVAPVVALVRRFLKRKK